MKPANALDVVRSRSGFTPPGLRNTALPRARRPPRESLSSFDLDAAEIRWPQVPIPPSASIFPCVSSQIPARWSEMNFRIGGILELLQQDVAMGVGGHHLFGALDRGAHASAPSVGIFSRPEA
jgi:hypothetical protein